MKSSILSVFISLLVFQQPGFSQSSPTINSGYQLVWYDDFTNYNSSQNKWFDNNAEAGACSGYDQLAVRLSENLDFSSGNSVKLITRKEQTPIIQNLCNFNPPTPISYDYSTAMLLSKQKFKYGYFEIECRFDDPIKGDVVAPNFWLFGAPHGIYSEIDVFEMKPCRNMDIPMCMYYGPVPNGPLYKAVRNYSSFCGSSYSNPWYTSCSVNTNLFDNSWHKYAVEWLPDEVKYYFDDILINTVNTVQYNQSTISLANAIDFGGKGGPAHYDLPAEDGIQIVIDVNLNYLSNVWYTDRPYCPTAIINAVSIEDILLNGTFATVYLNPAYSFTSDFGPGDLVGFTDIDESGAGLNTATGINNTNYSVISVTQSPPSFKIDLITPTGTWNQTGRAILDDGVNPCNNGNNWICREANASHEQSLPEPGIDYTYEIRSVKVFQRAFSENITKASLDQNQPNPFTEITHINYFIPEQTANAIIKIYLSGGQEIKTIALDKKGKAEISIDGGSISPGTYIYSLFVDDKLIDSKTMILTKQ